MFLNFVRDKWVESRFFRIFVLLIVPLLISLFFFWPSETTLSLIVENNKENVTPVTHALQIPDFSELNDKSGFGRMVRSIFSTPFDLKYYRIIVRDDSTYSGLDKTCSKPPTGVVFYRILLDDTLFDLPAEKETSVEALLDRQRNMTLLINLSAHPAVSIPGTCAEGIEGKIGLAISAKPIWYDVIAKIILFMLAWIALAILLKEVSKLIKGN